MDAMQRYVSKELTHFVGGNLRNEIEDKKQLLDEQYKVLLKIIQEKCISYPDHSRFRIPKGSKYSPILVYSYDFRNKFSDNSMFVPGMVCFCDIPVADLGIHISKFSPFGLSFKKSFLIERGANPVLYVERNSSFTYISPSSKNHGFEEKTRSEYFDEMVKIYQKHCNSALDYMETNDRSKIICRSQHCYEISKFLHNLLSYVKFFDVSKSDDSEENFYMEREWRTPYYVYFEINDIYRIILPSTYSERFRKDVPEYIGQITFSDEYSSV